MAKIRDRKVLITGGGAGIGLCTARQFAKAGYDLILTDVNREALDKAAAELAVSGVKVHTRVVDVSNRKDVDKMARWVINDLGGLDILINNAGIGYSGELADTTLETWEKLVGVNFWGPLYHIYAFLPHMIEKESGQIVNVSSGQAFFRLPTWGAYASIKLALGAVSEILHFEVRKFGIRVTTVYPFMVDTGFYSDVKAETFGQRLSMKLLPYYSMKPASVARLIYKAAIRKKKVEMISVINYVGFYSQFVPFLSDGMSFVTNWFLSKDKEECKQELAGDEKTSPGKA